MVLWRPTRPLELTPKDDVLFFIGDWNAKVGSQETPGVTGKFGLGIWNEARQKLIEFCQENTLVIANTFFQQHKGRFNTWTSPDGQHQNQIDYILCSQRWRSFIQSAKTRPGADCGLDHELRIAKFRLKLKKPGKTTRPFRYDINPLWLYSGSEKYIEGTRSDRQSAWWTMDRGSWHCTGGSDREHPYEKEMQKSKIAVWGGHTNSCEKKRSEKQRRKGKI